MTLTLRQVIWDKGRPSPGPEDYEVGDGVAGGRIRIGVALMPAAKSRT